MKFHTIILFSAVIFAAIFATSANSDDDEDTAAASDFGKAMKEIGKGGDPKQMFGKMAAKMKDFMDKNGKSGKAGGRGGKRYMKKMKEAMDKFKAMQDSPDSNDDKMAKAKDFFKNMMGKGKDNSDFKSGMDAFKNWGKKNKN